MSVCCECRVLAGRGLCDELITRPEESYRLCCVVVGDLETSRRRRPWPVLGRSTTGGGDYVNRGVMEYVNEVVWSHKMVHNGITCRLKTSHKLLSCEFKRRSEQ